MPVRLLLAAVLLLGAVAPAAQATTAPEPEPGQLVIEGQGNTTAELVLDKDLFLRGEPPTVSGGDGYAGVLVETTVSDSQTPRVIGGVRVRAFADGTQDTMAVLGFTGRLPEGRYRVTLLGDGKVRASFALGDGDEPGLLVVPRERIPVRFLHRAEPLAPGASTATVALDRALPPGRRALQVALLRGTSAGGVRMCATPAAQCEQPGRLFGALPGGTSALGQLVAPAPEARSLLWTSTGAHAAEDRLRAAALVF